MANRGEEKVRLHMNVVPRSTMKTNVGERVRKGLKSYLNVYITVSDFQAQFVI